MRKGRQGGGVLQAPGQRERRKGNLPQTSSNASRSPSLGHCSPTCSSVLAARTKEEARWEHTGQPARGKTQLQVPQWCRGAGCKTGSGGARKAVEESLTL